MVLLIITSFALTKWLTQAFVACSKEDIRLATFPSNLFYLWSLRERILPCPITLSNRWYKNFFCQKGLLFLENGKTGFLWFFMVGEAANVLKMCYLICVETAWHTVLNCCTMFSTEQPREQPQIDNRGSNPVAVNVLFFFLLGPHVPALFFHLVIFIILHGLLNLI